MCLSIIQEKVCSPQEAEAHWLKAINRRLMEAGMEDKIIATKITGETLFQT